MGNIDFADWLRAELEARKMTPYKLSKLSGKDQGVISRILNRERNPSNDTLESIARALKLPAADVFAAAGVLPAQPDPDKVPSLREWIEVFMQADEQTRDDLLDAAKALAMIKDHRKQA